MEQIVIKHTDNTQMSLPNYGASAVVTSATITEEHQGTHTLAITVESATPIDFVIGDTITVLGVTYTLLQLPQTQKQGERNFVYNATFEAPQYRLIDVQFLLPVDSKNSSLTGNFGTFLDILIGNANRASIPPITWRKGTISMPTIAEDETDTKTIDYSDTNCLSVLQDMCKQWGVEYQLVQDGTECVINIAPTIGATFPHTFQYGRGRGLYEIERINADSKDIITRLYVYGSHENLPLNYRASKLCLPASTGRNDSFVEDAEMREMYGLREGVQSFPDIKPQRVGAITSVNGLKSFVDTSMDFDLNEKMEAGSTKYLIDGTTAQIVFQTGNLAGYAFDISTYDHATKTFNINSYTDENDYQFPNPDSSAFQFAVGDRYIITGIRVPQSYIDTAEAKLLTEAQKYLDENAQPQVNYNLVLDPAYIGNLYPDMHVRVFRAGDYVRVADADVAPDEIATRITAVSINLMNNNDYSLTLGDSVQVSTIARMVSAIKSVQEVIVANDIDTTPAFQRRWRATEELRNMVFDPEGDYYSDKIKPMSIETTMLSVGARSQQYTLVNVRFKTNPILTGATAQDFNALVVNGGSLNHYTINADGTIRTWQIADATVTDLTPAQAYYIFAKCARVGNGATIVVDAQNHVFDEDATYYYFLIGTLSSSDAEMGRLLSLTYGSTTINGEHVQTGILRANNDKVRINLNTGEIFSQDGIKFIPTGKTDETSIEGYLSTALGIYDYLANAMKLASAYGSTTIDGGLVLTSAMVLSTPLTKEVMAGINGVIDKAKDIVAWYGGAMRDRENLAEGQSAEGSATALFRRDGTGYLAGGNIHWDENGFIYADPTSFLVGVNGEGDAVQLALYFVKIEGEQTITGVKTFVDGIKIGNGLIEWDEEAQMYRFNGSMYATGDVVAYGVGKTEVQSVIDIIEEYLEEHGGGGGGGYEPPAGGIPKKDLASDVQTSLGKADTAIQSLSGYATESWVAGKGYVNENDVKSIKVNESSVADYSLRARIYNHNENNVDYPIVWSNSANGVTDETQLFKSFSMFTYNPSRVGLKLWDANGSNYVEFLNYGILCNNSAFTIRSNYVYFSNQQLSEHFAKIDSNGVWAGTDKGHGGAIYVDGCKKIGCSKTYNNATYIYGDSIVLNNNADNATLFRLHASAMDLANNCCNNPIQFNKGLKAYNICIECDNAGANYSARSSEINCYNTPLYLQHNTSNNLYACVGGGNVGIGTTSPQYKLDVNGALRFAFSYFINNAGNGNAGWIGRGSSGNNHITLYAESGNDVFVTSATGSVILSANGKRVTITNGNVVSEGDSAAYSDARLKSDIKDLEFRGSLSPKCYIKDGKKAIGFIAQEVRELYPELVLGEEKDDEYLSLNYGAITAVLSAENRELKKEVDELKGEVEELKKMVKRLMGR